MKEVESIEEIREQTMEKKYTYRKLTENEIRSAELPLTMEFNEIAKRELIDIEGEKCVIKKFDSDGDFLLFCGKSVRYVSTHYRIREEVKEPETVTVYSCKYRRSSNNRVYQWSSLARAEVEEFLTTHNVVQLGEITEEVLEVKR
jgi:hypothetical protein